MSTDPVEAASTWEDRMAARAAARAEARRLEGLQREAEEQAALAAGNPAVEGEGEYIETDGVHKGHRTHSLPWHTGMVICQCGTYLGTYSYVLSGDEPDPGPCPVCAARGLLT